MYNALDSSQWHSTDDGRQADNHAAASSGTVRIESVNEPVQNDYVRIDPSARPVNLAAFAGVGVVLLLGAMFYLGVGNLRGDLVPQAAEQSIILTANGFQPSNVTLPAGSSISLKNDTGQPQVIKSDTENGPIPIPQILFDATPVRLTASASILPGTYTYYPETMSADTRLIIIVTAQQGTNAGVLSSSSSSAAVLMDDTATIPIPFDLPPASASVNASSLSPSPYTYPAAAPEAASSSSSSIATITAAANSKDGNVVLDIAPSITGSSSSTVTSTTSLPTNPLTVGNEKRSTVPASIRKTTALHGAASTRPVRTTASGPTEWLPVILTLLVFGAVSRRMLQGA